MKKLKIILIGVIVGGINGLLSTGAGLILVPALIYVLNEDEYTSRGTTIFIALILTIINIIIYRKLDIYITDIIPIVIGGCIGCFIGNKLLYRINKSILSLVFAVFTIIMGIEMIK